MRKPACIVLAIALACAGARGPTATRAWDGGSAPISVVSKEGVTSDFEIVMTARRPGIEIPMVRQDLNPYGRMNITVSIRNSGRSQEMIEVKAKFFDVSARALDSADWTQVYVGPGEVTRVELLCGEDGASTFKVLLR